MNTTDILMPELDHPVWHALTGPQAMLARGGPDAWRIDPAYGPFAAARPGREAALAGLLDECGDETRPDEIWVVGPEPVEPPAGLRLDRSARLLQMIADGPPAAHAEDPEVVRLDSTHIAAMAALAEATRPGPWRPSTWRYGPFYGIFGPAGLMAMAGERMRPAPGLAEVSGVCTWPEYRGRGLAARLIRRVMAGMAERGDTPFLHSYADNAGAIGLYRQLGFRPRAALVASVLARA